MGNKQTLVALHELLADASAVGAEETPQAGALRARIEAAEAWTVRASEFFGDAEAAPAVPKSEPLPSDPKPEVAPAAAASDVEAAPAGPKPEALPTDPKLKVAPAAAAATGPADHGASSASATAAAAPGGHAEAAAPGPAEAAGEAPGGAPAAAPAQSGAAAAEEGGLAATGAPGGAGAEAAPRAAPLKQLSELAVRSSCWEPVCAVSVKTCLSILTRALQQHELQHLHSGRLFMPTSMWDKRVRSGCMMQGCQHGAAAIARSPY